MIDLDFNSCFDDKQDERNIPYEFIAKIWVINNDLPSSYILRDESVLNQNIAEKYYYACVFFGEANNINEIYNKFGINRVITKWVDLADEAIDEWVLDIKKGANLIDWPKLAKKMNLINWFASINWLDEIKQALVNHWPVSVWSNLIDWEETQTNNNIVAKGWSYWHKFIIVWYDDTQKLLICENSYWKELFYKWRFYLRYDDLNLLFNTKTVNFINNDIMELINFYITKAKELWYKEFTENYIINKPDWIPKAIATLSAQIVFLKKVDKEKLLELIK